MCGICGIVSFNNQTTEINKISRMVNCLGHRGPDAQKFITLDSIALGHTRLSIIDISSKADQPLHDISKKYWIVYNGEIYNYKLLRDELLNQGFSFNTSSDTEVILNGYNAWGVNILDRLRGMFAFAVWDTQKKELFIARDRIGEKPFVYSFYNNCFYFASEINALLACGISKDIDEIGLLHYFGTMTSIPPPLTIYKHIKKLEQAHYAIVRKNAFIKKKYWHIDFREERNISAHTWIERCYDTLKEVAHLTLTSDVPVGLCLSGGVDSSALCALTKDSTKDLQYFTLASSSEDDPELRRSLIVAKRYHLQTTIIKFPLIQEYAPIASIPRDYGEPFCLYQHIYTTYFHKQIRKHVKTAITGNGADEIFCGYIGYNQILKSPAYRMFAFLNTFIPCGKKMNFFYMYKNIRNQSHMLLNDALLKKYSYTDVTSPYRHIFHNNNFQNPISAKCFYDLLYYHYHSTVYYPDISSMINGLEFRNPYLEHKLIELIATMPLSMLIHDRNDPNKNKYVLKKAMEPFLPEEILYAPKMGFGYGIDHYCHMRTTWKKDINETLQKQRSYIHDFVDMKKVTNVWNAFKSGNKKAGKEMFTLLLFLHWWDHFV